MKSQQAILTGFVFVIIIVVAIVMFVYYNFVVTQTQTTFVKNLNKYEMAQDARNQLTYCFGNPIQFTSLNKPCPISQIQGYKVSILPLYNCTATSIATTNVTRNAQEFVYAQGIVVNSTVCLGELVILI
jgi:hypothetical protein